MREMMMIGEGFQAHSILSSHLTYTTQSRDVVQGKNADTQLIRVFIGEIKYIVENLV